MSENKNAGAARTMAGIIARRAAKLKPTESAKYIEGFMDCIEYCTQCPMPEGVALLADLNATPSEPPPTTGEG